MTIIDRRLNPGQRNVVNRARFDRRFLMFLQKALTNSTANFTEEFPGPERKGYRRPGHVLISGNNLHDLVPKPGFSHSGKSGVHDYVLPHNKKFVTGDTWARNPKDENAEKTKDHIAERIPWAQFYRRVGAELNLPKRGDAFYSDNPQRVPVGHTVGTYVDMRSTRNQKRMVTRRIAVGLRNPYTIRQWEREIAKFMQKLNRGPDAADPQILQKLEALEDQRTKAEQRRTDLEGISTFDPEDIKRKHHEQRPKPISHALLIFVIEDSSQMTDVTGATEKTDRGRAVLELFRGMVAKTYPRAMDEVHVRFADEAETIADQETTFKPSYRGTPKLSAALAHVGNIIDQRSADDKSDVYVAVLASGLTPVKDMSLTIAEANKLMPKTRHLLYMESKWGAGLASEASTNGWHALAAVLSKHLVMKKTGSPKDTCAAFFDLYGPKEPEGKKVTEAKVLRAG